MEKKIIKLFKNYGCLAAEGHPVYTYSNFCSDIYDILYFYLPDDFDIYFNDFGSMILSAPWGWSYTPDELLQGQQFNFDNPAFVAIKKDNTLYCRYLRPVKEVV
ncbi:hypothetical protein AALB81_03275 [Lachnospiraceae bacterium 48-33]